MEINRKELINKTHQDFKSGKIDFGQTLEFMKINDSTEYAEQIELLRIQNKTLCIKASELEWLKHNAEISDEEYLKRVCEVNTNLFDNELTICNLTSEMVSLETSNQ